MPIVRLNETPAVSGGVLTRKPTLPGNGGGDERFSGFSEVRAGLRRIVGMRGLQILCSTESNVIHGHVVLGHFTTIIIVSTPFWLIN